MILEKIKIDTNIKSIDEFILNFKNESIINESLKNDCERQNNYVLFFNFKLEKLDIDLFNLQAEVNDLDSNF